MSLDMETDCRHVARSDDKFTARMRFHQSWYRRQILHRSPGPNPHAKGAIYGSHLTEKDGDAGRNFLTAKIYRVVQNRLGKNRGIVNVGDRRRLLMNLLSSQPMCFNLFASLANDLALATRLMQALPGMPSNIKVINVQIEYAPQPKRHYLNDATAFDAFIEYERANSIRGLVGIETKLTEPFSQKSYEFKDGYSRWRSSSDWWWRGRAKHFFPDKRYNQLWRNHLLAFAMLHQKDAAYDEAFCAVLYPEEDTSCADAIQAYRQRLRPETRHTLLEWTLGDVIDTWQGLATGRVQRKWLADFRLRYLDLKKSEAAWDAYQRETGARAMNRRLSAKLRSPRESESVRTGGQPSTG